MDTSARSEYGDSSEETRKCLNNQMTQGRRQESDGKERRGARSSDARPPKRRENEEGGDGQGSMLTEARILRMQKRTFNWAIKDCCALAERDASLLVWVENRGPTPKPLCTSLPQEHLI